jgi:hypothetical protein
MGDPCAYHQDIMVMLSESKATLAAVEERSLGAKDDIDSLFLYLRGLTDGQKSISSDVRDLTDIVLSNRGSVTGMADKLDKHLTNYAELHKEFNDFSWFRKALNGTKDRLIFFVAGILIVGVLFVLAITFLKDDVLRAIGWRV